MKSHDGHDEKTKDNIKILRSDMSNVRWTFGILIAVFTAIVGILIAFILFFSEDAHPQEYEQVENGYRKFGFDIVLYPAK